MSGIGVGMPFLVTKGPLTVAEAIQLEVRGESQALLGPVFVAVLRIAGVRFYLSMYQQGN